MTNTTFDAAKFQEVARKARAAEAFIIEEGRKQGISLTAEQARIFANACIKAHEEVGA